VKNSYSNQTGANQKVAGYRLCLIGKRIADVVLSTPSRRYLFWSSDLSHKSDPCDPQPHVLRV